MGGSRGTMDDLSTNGLDFMGGDVDSLTGQDPVNESIFDEFDAAGLLKEPLFDDDLPSTERNPMMTTLMMMDFNKSTSSEDAFGTFGDAHSAVAVPSVVPVTPTDSGTSSPFVATPQQQHLQERSNSYATPSYTGVTIEIDESQMRRSSAPAGVPRLAAQGLPLLDHPTTYSLPPQPQHHQGQRRSSPLTIGSGYGAMALPVPATPTYSTNSSNNCPPSPSMLGFDRNTAPTMMMPADMISVQSHSNSVHSGDHRSVSSYDLMQQQQHQQQSQRQLSPSVAPGQEIKSFNEAMEKLCESMKRSAMSRNLVKQLSGRNIVKQGSTRALPTRQGSLRSLPKQGSARFSLTKELSNHSLHTQLSSRSLHKQQSGRNLIVDPNNSGRVTPTAGAAVPIRRTSIDMKHRMGTSPGRGIYRQKSSGSLNGRRAQTAILQIDDNTMGIFYDDTIHA